jgi:hypothetical protein
MALPTNIPVGINATTTPGQYWTDEDGVSHYTGDVYNYTDQSGNLVLYTPPILSTGDDNGQGAGEIQVPARWTSAVLDPNAEDGYRYSTYLAPNASIEDMIRARGPSGYAGPLGAMLQALENANPNDTLFTPETFDRMNQTQMGKFGNYSSTESLTDLMNKAVQAAGAPDYATSGAAQIDKVPAVQAFNQGQTDKWNEQQKDTGTVFGDFAPILDVVSNVFFPVIGPAAVEFVNNRGDVEAAAKAAAFAYAAGAISGSEAVSSGVSEISTSIIDAAKAVGMSAEQAAALASSASSATKTALTSGLNAVMSGKGDPFEAAITGGAFSMLGGSVAKLLTLEGVNSTISSTIANAIVQEVRNGSIDPNALLTSAVSNELNPRIASILKENNISADLIPTITRAVNQAVTTGDVDPTKLFSSAVLDKVNSGAFNGVEAGINDATNTIVDANLTNAGYANTGNGSYTYTYDDGSTITVDANMNPIGSTEASDATNSVGALTDAGYVANNNGTYTYTYDDGSTITVDADMNPIGSTEASDEYTSAGGAGSASGKSGIAGKLGTAVLGGVKNAVKPITTSSTGKPIIAPPTGKASATTPGSTTPGSTTPGATTPGATTPGATTPGATTPAGTADQTQQNQQNSLLMGLLLGEQPQQPPPQQTQQLAKITPYDWDKDILGAADYVNATQSDYFTGGSVSAVNEELLRMLRS